MKNKKIKKLFDFFNARNIFVIFGGLFIFFMALRQACDPDMGWHLKDGEYLVQNNFQAAKTDIFSYTMPDFPLIMHEWVTDSIMWLIYSKLGIFSLSVFFALITTAAFVLVSFGLSAKREYKIIAAILGVIASVPILGVRPQMLNLLGLALVIFIIFRFRENNKTKIIYFLPLILFLWVNLHGGFAVGIFFLGLFLGIEIIKNILLLLVTKFGRVKLFNKIKEKLFSGVIAWKYIYKLSIFSLLSFISTFINPYGWRVYIEVFTTIFDKYAKENIGEWLPVTISNPMGIQFFIYIILLVILLAFSFRKIDWSYLIICAVFAYLGFSSWRHMPVFLIVSIPLWVNIVEAITGEELVFLVKKKWFLASMGLIVAVTIFQGYQRINSAMNVEQISKLGNYPLKAVQYLKENKLEGNMFNEYNWGGFLIWQYPEKKTFIDGRMPSWKMGEVRILERFNNIMRYEDGWEKKLDEYDISFVLIGNNPFNQAAYRSIGWTEAYSDELSVVFLRNK
jgi:hypothetical protein